MIIAWTTVEKEDDARRLARGAVERRLAVCTQVDGPIESHFPWQGRIETAREYRLWFKCLPTNASALGLWVQANHPYEVPQWIEVSAETVGEKYLSWAIANSTSPPFPSPNSS